MTNGKDESTKDVSWLKGQVAKCHRSHAEKNQSGEPRPTSEIQLRRRRTRSPNRGGGGDGRSSDGNIKASNSGSKSIEEVSGDLNRPNDGRPRSERRLAKVRLADIQAALTPEQIEELALGGELTNPDEEVEIRYNVVQSPTVKEFYSEDLILNPKRRRKKKRSIGPKKTPTETLSEEYDKWVESSEEESSGHQMNPVTPEIVLGCYLKLYKEACGEEDASVSNKDLRSLYFYIRKMASEVAEGKMENIIFFIENLIPLWFANIDPTGFPNTRPTTKAFFINRNIWNNRRNYYQRWKR